MNTLIKSSLLTLAVNKHFHNLQEKQSRQQRNFKTNYCRQPNDTQTGDESAKVTLTQSAKKVKLALIAPAGRPAQTTSPPTSRQTQTNSANTNSSASTSAAADHHFKHTETLPPLL